MVNKTTKKDVVNIPKSQEPIELDEKAWKKLVHSLETPAEPTKALIDLMKS